MRCIASDRMPAHTGGPKAIDVIVNGWVAMKPMLDALTKP
jgi:hypothetical protein